MYQRAYFSLHLLSCIKFTFMVFDMSIPFSFTISMYTKYEIKHSD